jgi:DNA-binding response OmpR family regulator
LKNRILLVDDEHDNNLIFTIGLQDAGFEVDAYNDPKLALSAFRPDYYDLLILDIRMPKMNGYELSDKIRNKDNKVNVCFLTASERYKEERRPNSMPDNFTSFLIKTNNNRLPIQKSK